MQPAIAYLLKMSLCSAILLGYYWLALRNERFHHWNRFYLLAALVLSLAVPFVNIPLHANEEPAMVVTMVTYLPWNKTAAPAPFVWNWQLTVLAAAMLVSVMLLVQLIASVIKVIRLYRKNPATTFNDVSLVVTGEESAPFSFFKWLFWRQDIDPGTQNGQRMLQHELAHIGQKHSADKLFTELLLIVFWMNPFFWIIRRELYAIHEFLADQKAIARNDGAAFAAMILQAAHAAGTPALANPFFTSQLKRRLIMITTSRSPRYSYLRRISGLVLMLATAVVLVLSIQQVQAQEKVPPPPPPPPPVPAISNQLPDSIKSIQVIAKNGVSYVHYQMKDGRKLVYTTEQVKSKKLYLPPPPPPPPPAPANTTPSAPADPAGTPGAPPTQRIAWDAAGVSTDGKPLYIYADLKITAEQMQEIDPATIESIDVLKDEEAVKIYGEAGKNGVVRITPKPHPAPAASTTIAPQAVTISPVAPTVTVQPKTVVKTRVETKSGAEPVYVINSNVATTQEVAALKTDEITSVNVVKNDNAVKQYGSAGKNGVVEITTTGTTPQPDATPKIFLKAETMPSFSGGASGWTNFLKQNMNYPLEARKAKASGVVTVQFIVNTDGSVKDIKALNDPGYGLAAEAERLIKISPKWNAAVQNGHKVAAMIKQEIRFQPG